MDSLHALAGEGTATKTPDIMEQYDQMCACSVQASLFHVMSCLVFFHLLTAWAHLSHPLCKAA